MADNTKAIPIHIKQTTGRTIVSSIVSLLGILYLQFTLLLMLNVLVALLHSFMWILNE